MSRATIVLCFPVTPDQVAQISGLAEPAGFNIRVSNQEDIAGDIFDADIFCGHAKTVPVDWSAVVDQGRLKWIQSSAAGLDHCLAPAVIDSDIIVSGCSGLFANQVAEQTLAILFGLLRQFPVFFRAQMRKEYVRRPTDEIAGKSVGIAGFGGNGQRIAQVLKPVADKILATDMFHNQFVDSEDWFTVLPDSELIELFRQSDVVISTLPLSESNYQIIGEQCFRAMKKGSYFINVGRGATVDQTSLTRHLRSEHLAAVGLDVADPEPIPRDDPLWEMENVIITPHVGAQSKYRVPRTVDLFCDNLQRYLSHDSLVNLVDKKLGFPRPEHRLQIDGVR